MKKNMKNLIKPDFTGHSRQKKTLGKIKAN